MSHVGRYSFFSLKYGRYVAISKRFFKLVLMCISNVDPEYSVPRSSKVHTSPCCHRRWLLRLPLLLPILSLRGEMVGQPWEESEIQVVPTGTLSI